MKRIVCLLAAILLVCAMMPVATAEGEVTLRLVGNLEPAQVGDTVTVTAYIENAPKCLAFEIDFLYDTTVLKPISVQKGAVEGLFEQNINYEFNGEPAIKVLGYDYAAPIFSGNVLLATFTFEVIGETSGKYGTVLTPCTYRFSREADDPQELPVFFAPQTKNGRVYVGVDEVLSTAQAVEILRHLIGIPSDNEEYLDWNGDKSLSVLDAVLLLRELN